MNQHETAERLTTMAAIFQSWLDWHAKGTFPEGVEINDDMHIMSPNKWPSRGQLRVWIKTLEDARTEIL